MTPVCYLMYDTFACCILDPETGPQKLRTLNVVLVHVRPGNGSPRATNVVLVHVGPGNGSLLVTNVAVVVVWVLVAIRISK